MHVKGLKRAVVACLGCGFLVSAPLRAQQTPSPLTSLQHVTITRDIDDVPAEEYADARDRLDVYVSEGARNVPVVVFFHGGELRYGSKAQGEYLAARLVPMDIGVAAANYRLCPISPFLYLEETAPDRPKTVWGEDPAVWPLASVTPQIGPEKGRWLLIYADGDDAWRQEQNEGFAAAMVAAGNREVRVVQVPNRAHTSLITALNEPDDRIGGRIRDFITNGALTRP